MSKKIQTELRTSAFLLGLFKRASVFRFKLLHKFMSLSKGKNIKGYECDEKWIPQSTEGADIRLRIYRNKKSAMPSDQKLPVVLYLHGGGYVMGVPEITFQPIKKLLKTRDCVVVAPDYRKAFDHPYPAALYDSYDTLLWIKNNAEGLGVRDDQIMVCGHSAGGGLTAATCLYARDKGEVNVAFQMPIYPMIDDRMQTLSSINNTLDPVWDSANNRLAWDIYLSELNKQALPIPIYAAPSRATDYSNLPPTATFVGGAEPFKDETIAYVKNLEAANVPVNFKLFEGCFHAFENIVPKANISQEADSFFMEAFAYAVDHYFAAQVAK